MARVEGVHNLSIYMEDSDDGECRLNARRGEGERKVGEAGDERAEKGMSCKEEMGADNKGRAGWKRAAFLRCSQLRGGDEWRSPHVNCTVRYGTGILYQCHTVP